MSTSPPQVTAAEAEAHALDSADPGPHRRAAFAVPRWPDGRYPDLAYFAGNSLGLQPHAVRQILAEELDDWARLGVAGHEQAGRPWVSYADLLRGPAARLVGALPHETVAMNSLTVNLHLMMATFYRPSGIRTRIVIEDNAFPSDSYAVRSQAVHHGLDPDETVVRLRPRPGEDCLRTEDIEAHLAEHGERTALVMLGGVNYLTGEVLDIERITRAGHAAGAVVGWDLAHAAGNVPLRLHEWGVDWAAWCSYKYLNSGPGAVAGCFVHERHAADPALPRLSGWFGHDLADRFRMPPVFRPTPDASAWQLSNPPILALAPVLASLRIFDEVGMTALRERSLRLTGYLRRLLDDVTARRPLSVITPRDERAHGCQLSIRAGAGAGDVAVLAGTLREHHGVVADVRRPDVIRFAPIPLYSTFHDCWRAADALARTVAEDA